MQFRLDLYAHGINNTIQWIDGSFVEDKMSRDNSEPNDIDVVSFMNIPPIVQTALINAFPEFANCIIYKQMLHFRAVLRLSEQMYFMIVNHWIKLL